MMEIAWKEIHTVYHTIKKENVKHVKKDLSYLKKDAAKIFLSAHNSHQTTSHVQNVNKDINYTKDGVKK